MMYIYASSTASNLGCQTKPPLLSTMLAHGKISGRKRARERAPDQACTRELTRRRAKGSWTRANTQIRLASNIETLARSFPGSC